MNKFILTIGMLALTSPVLAQTSIWGPAKSPSDTQLRQERPVSPYLTPVPQAVKKATQNETLVHPTIEPGTQPAWSLDEVPSDPSWGDERTGDVAVEPRQAPPMVLDKNEVLRLVNDPAMRKVLEGYAQNGHIVLPQNPPQLNEKTAAILPRTEVIIPSDNGIDYFDFDDECPTQNCPEDE